MRCGKDSITLRWLYLSSTFGNCILCDLYGGTVFRQHSARPEIGWRTCICKLSRKHAECIMLITKKPRCNNVFTENLISEFKKYICARK